MLGLPALAVSTHVGTVCLTPSQFRAHWPHPFSHLWLSCPGAGHQAMEPNAYPEHPESGLPGSCGDRQRGQLRWLS